MTDSKNSVLEHMSAPVDSVLEYKGKLRFLAGEDSVPSAANALLVERSDEAGDEAGYWTCMVELLLKERCPNERLD
ncbi:MAG: hypothetical protein LUD01_04450 [Clostridiales bacterium]|nr:hypothetical protein [Clostridiales bacterium]